MLHRVVALLLLLELSPFECRMRRPPTRRPESQEEFMSQKELVEFLRLERYIKSTKVKSDAQRGQVPLRKNYPYSLFPDKIDMCSLARTPIMCAKILEYNQDYLKNGSNVLDVNMDNGYLTVLFGLMVSPGGRVTGLSYFQEECSLARSNTRRSKPSLLKKNVIDYQVGYLKEGIQELAPFDLIFIGGHTATKPPPDLIKQIKPGGRMLVPKMYKDGDLLIMYCYDRYENGTLSKKKRLFSTKPVYAKDI